MDDETKAALGRIRKERQGENVYPSWFPDYDMESRKDSHTLAEAYLAEHPADDDEPIDDAFAKAVGQCRFPNGLTVELIYLEYQSTNESEWVVVAEDWEGESVLLIKDAKTKGQVRRLIVALEGK